VNDRFQNFIDNLGASAVYQIIFLCVTGAISALGVGFGKISDSLIKNMLITITVFSVILSFYIWYKKYGEYSYTLLKQDVILEFFDGITPRLTKNIKAKARKNGLTSIRNLSVSKSDKVTHELLYCDRGHRMEVVEQVGAEKVYNVCYLSPLRRGDIINYRVRANNPDMEKFLSIKITCPTRKMQLAVYTETDFEEAKLIVYKDYPNKPINKTVKIGKNNYVVWNIKRPTVGLSYQISWE
jgi:hypothetical protein